MSKRAPKTSPERASSQAKAENFQRSRSDHAGEIAQDYVEAIAELSEEMGEARVVDLAQRLGVTHVTVNRTLVRLRLAELVNGQPYRAIFLTDKGLRLANECKRRHEIVVAFLKSLGIPEKTAEMDAEGIEHHVSPDTLVAFERMLKRP